ncbi:PREDICTED: transmembrane protein 56-A-like [Branchiostoma belcheri]|uniref:Transmembrane protein 56-A-like n=1 Tax=Branchiostoma belcheri TaxID=7741 RepID=A0A6P4Y0Y5_BRABE|nr:PREDICTED: transmembrane protein 56-A-like [Branchiostoma belcheri]
MAYGLQHILTIVSSLIFHLSIFRWLAAPVMKKKSPTFKKLSPKEQVVITNSVMSLVHSVVVGGMSVYVFMYPGQVLPTVFWYDSSITRHAACIFLGYTVADLLIMATHPAQYDLMMMVHHVMGVFGSVAGSVDPVLPYYSNLVLLQELSSPFMNMRIILYSLGQKTTHLYKLNGVLLLLVFFTCRLATIPLWFRLSPFMATGQLYTVSTPLLVTIFGCMPVVSMFNLYWFTKMCKGAYRILCRA